MSNQLLSSGDAVVRHDRPKRRRVLLAMGTLVAAAGLILGGAGVANAGTPGGITSPTSGSTISAPLNVTGNAPTGATVYAVAICNIDSGVVVGTRCSADTGSFTNLANVPTGGAYSATLTATPSSFNDFDFTTQSPGTTSTDCSAFGSDSCAIAVSYYTGTTSAPVPLTSDYVPVSF